MQSQLGSLILGYDLFDEVEVTWVGNTHGSDGSNVQTFAYNSNLNPTVLKLGVPTIISKAQARVARENGAILILSRPIYDVIVDDSGGAIGFPLPRSTGSVVGTGPGSFLGYTVRETSGNSRATILLYDDTVAGAGGVLLEAITLNGGATASDEYPSPGRQVLYGIYAQITGSVEGTIFQ